MKYIGDHTNEYDLKFSVQENHGDNIFTVTENGAKSFELVKEDEIWMETYHGVTSKATEYGALIDRFFVFTSDQKPSHLNAGQYPEINL